jgi:putative FmdB family regulatory protein
MPIFEYRCRACEQTMELVVLSSSDAVCPHCGSADLAKLISAPAAHGKTASFIASARAQASKEGHFSNYSAREKSKLKVP